MDSNSDKGQKPPPASEEQNLSGNYRKYEGQAGMSFAPPYDPSQELDPSKAPVVSTPEPLRREDFVYFRQQIERNARYARLALMVAVVALLLANIWLTRQSTSNIIQNIDLDRDHQSSFEDGVDSRLNKIEQRLTAIDSRLSHWPQEGAPQE